jgi:hypothetical protein
MNDTVPLEKKPRKIEGLLKEITDTKGPSTLEACSINILFKRFIGRNCF